MFEYLVLTVNLVMVTKSYELCATSMSKDSLGLSWFNYCDSNKIPVLFYKDYSKNWTYVTDKDLGIKNYAFRIPYTATPCNEIETDIEGYTWTAWCLQTGEKIKFQKKNGKFVIDKISGEEIFNWRRVIYEKKSIFQSFLEIPENHYELKCIELEGDTSGRYFPVDYDENHIKIEYQKDFLGNFILDPILNERITGHSLKKVQINTDLPLCQCENLFEIDPSHKFYWIIEFKKDLPIVFIESSDTYYYISPENGKRKAYQ